MLAFYICPIILIPILIYEKVLFLTGIIFLLSFVYTYFVIKFYLIKKERKIICFSHKESDESGNYFIGKDNSKYEVCSKMYDSLEGNETIDAIIKNRDILEVLAIIKDNEKQV
jgi:hypothetical protein